MKKLIIRKNDKLLSIVKKIFGQDLVTNAYVTAYHENPEIIASDDEKRMCILDNLDEADKGFSYEFNTGLNYDAEEIIIEFINGKKIAFSNSEWGFINSITEEDLLEI